MTILAAMCEGKTRGIGEMARCAVDNFGNQSKRLKSARTEILQKQQFGELVKIAFVRDGEHGSETLQVDVLGAERGLRFFMSDVEQGGLRVSVHEIHDRALVLADYAGVWFGDEVAHRRGVPVVAASHPAPIV